MTGDIQLSRNFTLSEFVAVSHRALTENEVARAREHVALHLQPARRELGAIRVTSFVRAGDRIGGGTHGDGAGVDIVPVVASIDDLFAWYKRHPWAFGQVIHEGDHLHVTLPGIRGKVGEVLIMDAPGSFRFGLAWFPIVPALLMLAALSLLAFAS